jgi:hypothetical protein
VIEFLSLVRFLIDGGANPNIHRRVEDKIGTVIRQAGTVLDIFASKLLDLELHWSRGWSIDKSVYESLIDGGAIFSRPLATCVSKHPVFYFDHFKQEVAELQTFEEQVDGILCLPIASCHHTKSVCVVSDLNDLMVSIIRRNEPDFLRALGKDDIHAVSRANGLRAIHLAIYWPWALKQIIQAGADVNCEDNDQRRPIHLAVACRQAQSVGILLQADCSVSTPDYSNSLLQEALTQGREFDNVTDLIIDALIDRHTRLRDLALSVLPNDSGPSVDTEKETLSEIRAPEIYDSLIRAKHNIPPALQVDRDEEGVYDTAAMHGDIRLTASLADKLWRGGFHRFDEFAPLNGLTPLLRSWFIADFDMVSWFIEKGASPFTTHRDGLLSGLHLYAARIAYPGAHFHHDRKEVPISPQNWHQLTRRGDMWHDSCHCSCSISGCTPISILIKTSWRFLLRERNDNYAGMMELLSICRNTMIYEPERDPCHIQQLVEAIVFERMNLRHTCCYIGQLGQIEVWPEWETKNKRLCEGDLEVDFRQLLADYAVKMLECQCPAAEKPICVIFRDTCGTTV